MLIIIFSEKPVSCISTTKDTKCEGRFPDKRARKSFAKNDG